MKSRLALLAVPFLALACTDAEQATLIAPERSAIETGTLTSPGGDAAVAANVILCDDETITGTKKADIIDCSGSPVGVTISGGGGNDMITGSPYADIISGGASNDMIYGGGGNDILCGGVCDSPAASSSPRDRFAALGSVMFHAGHAGDCMKHNKNDPGCDGGGGNETKGGSGSDIIDGGEGNDTILGGSGDDIIHGGDGDDNINGGNHSDMLYGDDGNDILEGSHHNDTLDGGAGEDTLDGGAGTDVCDGGADSDFDEANATCETISNVP